MRIRRLSATDPEIIGKMSSLTLFFSAILFFTSKQCASVEVARRIEKSTRIAFSSRFSNTVEIGDRRRYSSECDVCVFNFPDEPRKAQKIYKFHAFNVFLNCKFANWTVKRIYDVFVLSPLFYQYKFQNFDRYDEEYGSRFDGYIDGFMTEFDGNAEHFVRVLSAVLDSTPRDARYDGTTDVLKALKSLRLKINLVLKKRADDMPPGRGRSDFETIRLLLADMIGLQRFLSINCPEIPSTKKNSRFYGYWIAFDHGLTNRDIKNVMRIVDDKLRSANEPFCTLPNDLLENVLHLRFGNPTVSSYVKDAIDRASSVPSNGYSELIDRYCDIDVVFEYQDLVLNVVFELIETRVKELAGKKCLDENTTATIGAIYSRMKTDESDFPAYMVDGFRDLSTIKNETTTGDGCGTQDATSRTVCELLTFVGTNVDDIKRLEGFFSSVRRERDGLGGPLPPDEKRAHFLNNENNSFADGCSFVRNVYSLCFQAIANLNGYADDRTARGSYRKTLHRTEFAEVSDKIFGYCFAVIEHGPNGNVREIALDAAVVVVNTPIKSVNKVQNTDVLRGFKVIMNEMNGYHVRFCTTDKTNFSIFNNLDFDNFGNRRSIDRSMTAIFEANGYAIGDSYFEDFRRRGVRFLKLHTLNGSWIKSGEIADVIVKFEDRIRVYWKGSVQNLSDIFDYEEQIVFDSRNLYALYDVYFLYTAAIVFVQIKDVVTSRSRSTFNDLNAVKQNLNTGNVTTWYDLFPRKITYFVQDIDKLFDVEMYVGEENGVKAKKKWLKRKMEIIEKRFTKSNIVFMRKKFGRSLTFKEMQADWKLLSSLITTLKKVSKAFAKIKFGTSIRSDDRPDRQISIRGDSDNDNRNQNQNKTVFEN